jgi:cell filamentation protein
VAWNDYFYPGTEVLRNKLDIRDAEVLSTVEHELAARRQIQLERGEAAIERTFDAKHLRALHFYLFQDVYPFAGRYRDVAMSKASRFADLDQIDTCLARAATIVAETPWDRVDDDQFCDRAARIYGWVNFAHCFREGNGRAARLLMSDIAGLAGRCLDYGAIRREVFVQRAAFSCPDLSQSEPDYRWMEPVFQQIARPEGDLTISTDFLPQQRDAGSHDLGL